MVQRPRPDLRGGCAAIRIPTATAGGPQQWGFLPRSGSVEGPSFDPKRRMGTIAGHPPLIWWRVPVGYVFRSWHRRRMAV